MWLGTTILASIATETTQHHRKFYMAMLGYNIHTGWPLPFSHNMQPWLLPLPSRVSLYLSELDFTSHSSSQRHVSSSALLILLSPWTISYSANFTCHICKWVCKSACTCHSLKVQTLISRDQQVLTHSVLDLSFQLYSSSRVENHRAVQPERSPEVQKMVTKVKAGRLP